jgi:hypothetical protein
MEPLALTLSVIIYFGISVGVGLLVIDAFIWLRRRYRAVRIAWAALKTALSVCISPVLFLLFRVRIDWFMTAFTALWPHLDILDEKKDLYLRRFFMTPKTPWFRPRFLHFIAQDDKGRDPHDHPGPFKTKILRGGYDEFVYFPLNTQFRKFYGTHKLVITHEGDVLENKVGHTHMLTLHGPTWTWVVGWISGKPWGFWKIDPDDANKDRWVFNEDYGVKGEEIRSWDS